MKAPVVTAGPCPSFSSCSTTSLQPPLPTASPQGLLASRLLLAYSSLRKGGPPFAHFPRLSLATHSRSCPDLEAEVGMPRSPLGDHLVQSPSHANRGDEEAAGAAPRMWLAPHFLQASSSGVISRLSGSSSVFRWQEGKIRQQPHHNETHFYNRW